MNHANVMLHNQRCRACIHPVHNGICHRGSDTSGYRCGCHASTVVTGREHCACGGKRWLHMNEGLATEAVQRCDDCAMADTDCGLAPFDDAAAKAAHAIDCGCAWGLRWCWWGRHDWVSDPKTGRTICRNCPEVRQ